MSLKLDLNFSNGLFLENMNPKYEDLKHFIFLKNKKSFYFKEGIKEFNNLLLETIEKYYSKHFSCMIDFILNNDIKIKIDQQVYHMFPYILKQFLQIDQNQVTLSGANGLSASDNIQIFFKYFFNPNRYFIQYNGYIFDEVLKDIIWYISNSINNNNTTLCQYIFSEPNTLQYFYDYKREFLLRIKDLKGFSSVRAKFNFDEF